MVLLAGACISATFYESKHGTPAAQRAFYGTWWFTLLLGLLAVNVLGSMLKRLPWSRHHVGFVLAHVGILLILGGSVVSLFWGLDSQMGVYEGETTDRLSLTGQALRVGVENAGAISDLDVDFASRPPGPGHEKRFEAPNIGATLVAEDYLPHVQVSEGLAEGSQGGPALHFVIASQNGRVDDWLVADDPARASANLGPLGLSLQAATTPEETARVLERAGGANHIVIVLGPDGLARYRLDATSGGGSRGVVLVGRPIQTPWMGMTLTVDRLLRHAEARHSVAPAALPDKEDRRRPAVKLSVEGAAGRSEPFWLAWGDVARIPTARGTVAVAFRNRERSVPFRVTLLRFNSDKYPGSNMPATYESYVRVDDPELGVSEHHIAMNDPLHYRGYIFFQSSYVEGTPMMSVFSVARAPGLPAVYAGTAFLCVGVLWMFYLKPYLARRQAAKALAARRAPAPSHSLGEPARGQA